MNEGESFRYSGFCFVLFRFFPQWKREKERQSQRKPNYLLLVLALGYAKRAMPCVLRTSWR